ncbi:hypothetical protein [Propionivibrio sp.]|nr:hypothetical protein [Propionivibrio sp.]
MRGLEAHQGFSAVKPLYSSEASRQIGTGSAVIGLRRPVNDLIGADPLR